ncbi:hypothetical protein H6F50_14820 [Coleofasciculus sp. FACHB-712]|nr:MULTISPECIES: hypothetical protein [unclassified Coleofasciculus]MBD1943615.1 hypothetical protein [Coleofasciculus sp. FACHB-712]MBD2086475.1 hypothetical protein [Coleofasciculus sp. FACHB-542]
MNAFNKLVYCLQEFCDPAPAGSFRRKMASVGWEEKCDRASLPIIPN